MKETKFIYIFSIILFIFLFSGCHLKEKRLLKTNSILNIINGKVRSVDDSEPDIFDLNKDYYFIFYGADWCPYCKEIRDDILNFYNEFKKTNDNFEFIFAGCKKDTSNEDLITYLKNEEFPFYYIDFDFRDECGFFEFPPFSECEYFYIPGFILLDKSGNVLSNSNGKLKSDYAVTRPFIYYTENLAEKK